MGYLKSLSKLICLCYCLGAFVAGIEQEQETSRRTARSHDRGLSGPFSLLSDQLLSSSSLIHHLIKLNGPPVQRRMLPNTSEDSSLYENSLDEKEDAGPQSSALIDDVPRDPYRWRFSSSSENETTLPDLPVPSDYSPEPFVYICRDPSKCRPTPGPFYTTSTAAPPHLKYGYRRVNASRIKDEEQASEKDEPENNGYKTIYRSQIRKVKKKRPSLMKPVNKDPMPEFKDMSLQELQDFMKTQSKKVINGLPPNSPPSTFENEEDEAKKDSSDPYDLMMKEIKKIHEHNQMMKSTDKPVIPPSRAPLNHRPMKPFVVKHTTPYPLPLDMLMISLKSSTTTQSPVTMSSSRATAFTVRPTFRPMSTSSEAPKTMSPFEIMLLRMKEKDNSPSKPTAFTVRPTSTLPPRTTAQTTTTMASSTARSTTTTFLPESSTVFTVRPTTANPRDSSSTMSAFEMMVMRMKQKQRQEPTRTTAFTVRPSTPSQSLNSQLADLGMNSLMKIITGGGGVMKTIPTTKPTKPASFMNFKTPTQGFKEEELRQETEYDRPPRRPHDPYHYMPKEVPFTVRPTRPVYKGVQRTTPYYAYAYHQSTPFTVRPTTSYRYRTTKKIPYQPQAGHNYQVRDSTPFTVFGKKKSALPESPTSPPASFKHDVELKDPFSYDGSSFMSGMKELQHESKPYYIPEAPNPKVIHDKSYQLGPEDVIVNPFKVHPFETNEPESVKSKFQAINLSNYGHDDRPLLSSSTYEEDEEINDEEDYYDDNGDFDQYDMEGLISKLNHEKNQEETMFDSVLPKNDDHFSEHQLEEDISAPYLNDFHVKSNPPFTVFKPSITTPSPEYVPTFSKFPDFQEFEGSFDHKSNNNFEVDKSTHEYFRPDDVFGKNQITLEPGSLPDRPLEVGTVFRDLPHMKSPHPQYPKNVKEPPPPVPTTADFVSQYLKNPYGKDFIRMEIDQDKFKSNRTKPGSIHVPLMVKNYAVRPGPVTTPAPHHKKPARSHRPGKPKRRPSKKPFPKIANPMKTILSDLKNLRKVMFNIPNAIGDLPSYMKGLVSNKASFAGRAFSDQDITLEDLFDVEAEDGASETDKTEEESKVEEEDDNSE